MTTRAFFIAVIFSMASAGCSTSEPALGTRENPIKINDPAFSSSVNRDAIKAVVLSHQAAISACYEDAIEKRPGAMGKVIAKWDIIPDGTVRNASLREVDPSMTDIEPCLIHEIGTWKFEVLQSGDVREIHYPFHFDERRSKYRSTLAPTPAPSATPAN